MMTRRSTRNILLLIGMMSIASLSLATDPRALPDRSWVTVSGTVTEAADNGFRLDYGEGSIYVEMDDWDWYREGRALISGQHVQVLGRIDDDAFERRSIEASKVYVKSLNSVFFEPTFFDPAHDRMISASPEDEELMPEIYSKAIFGNLTDGAFVSITGKVTDIDGHHFTVDTGANLVRVDTHLMPYNPFDDLGYQKIEPGQMVSVTGRLDLDVFEKKEIIATTITSMVRDSK